MYKINLELLKKVKEQGHCLCNIGLACPCKNFLEKQECKCGVYTNIIIDESNLRVKEYNI